MLVLIKAPACDDLGMDAKHLCENVFAKETFVDHLATELPKPKAANANAAVWNKANARLRRSGRAPNCRHVSELSLCADVTTAGRLTAEPSPRRLKR